MEASVVGVGTWQFGGEWGKAFTARDAEAVLERGLKMRTETVDVWLDTGTIEATLETNRHLLSRLPVDLPARWDAETCQRLGVKLYPPLSIHETAEINNSVIGPHASIGANCRITDARVEDSILEAGVTVDSAALKGSFIGRQARIVGRSADDPPLKLNIGDNSSVILK
jgi:glucose-1-phosphate thymidylyltransferase